MPPTLTVCLLLLAAAASASAAADPAFRVPPLPYNLSALAPAVPEDTLALHYGVHTKNYFNATNALVAAAPALRNQSLATLLSGPARTGAGVTPAQRLTLTNQGGGAYNHGLYFNQLAPSGKGGAMPAGLKDALNPVNATLAAWQAAANQVFGSGWSWLTYVPANRSVIVTTSANQENPLTKGDGIPIAGIDVWEHSYYRAFGPKRADHVALLVQNNMNWTRVEDNLKAARAGDAGAASGVV